MHFFNCSLHDFLEQDIGKIVCFGGGNYCKAFFEECDYMGIRPNVIAIADNCREQVLLMPGQQGIPVIGIEELKEIVSPEIVLLITTAYYKEVVGQLEYIKELEDINYYIYPMMQIFAKQQVHKIYGFEHVQMIPPVIHYCWFGRGELPPADRKYIEGWKKICPDYEVIEWNEDNYDVGKCGYTNCAYEQKRWAFVSDYARIDILNQYGGVYFDTDVELLKSIDQLRYHKAFVGVEAAGGINSGLGCGFIKGHPMLKRLLEHYQNVKFLDKKGNFIIQVNANCETELFRKYGFKRNNQFQMIQDTAVYPSEFFSPLVVGSDCCHLTQDTYSIHHYHYSWRN